MKPSVLKAKAGLLCLFLLLAGTTLPTMAQTWKNPFIVSNEWDLYGIGDPYILKFNGYYYLYCSTRDSETGIKVWSSKNLQNWKYEGLCATQAITKCAYAPEVIYYNGKFYMYTSPFGNGHYILQSDSPTGPFTTVTQNLGHSIDGSVLKDNNGTLYFYHSGDDGIHAHLMSSPTVIGSDLVLGTTRMNGWTEGPCVIKRNGKYYMIYTGNHVISKGYRIDMAVSSSPASNYVAQSNQNPVLLSTEGTHIGLGHGSILQGPDLDSHYLVYHNFAGDFGVGPYRHFNFDRIGWNGSKMLVMGPTNTDQVVPDMPDYSDYFETATLDPTWTIYGNAAWTIENSALNTTTNNPVSEEINMALAPGSTGNYFTAEFNISQPANDQTDAVFGVIFNFTDQQNYDLAVINPKLNRLETRHLTNGTWSNTSISTLSGVADHTKPHCLRIERNGNKHNLYVDDMLKKTLTIDRVGGRVGYCTYKSNAKFGPIAYSRKINGSGIFNQYKPVPGTIDASLYTNQGEGISYHDLTPTNTESTSFRLDAVENILTPSGDYCVKAEEKEWLKYAIMVKSSSGYHVGLKYAASTTARIRLSQVGSTQSTVVDLPATGGEANWRTKIIEELYLNKGKQDLLVEILSGTIQVYHLKFVQATAQLNPKTVDFEGLSSLGNDWSYKDGDWTCSGQDLLSGHYGKCLLSTPYANYTASVDVKYESSMNGGLLIRANNPSMGGSGKDVIAGADFVQAYFITLGTNGCTLGKLNYNWKNLKTTTGSYVVGQTYRLTVKAEDDNIKVFIDNAPEPIIDYTDPDPFILGKTGLRTFNSIVHFDNLQLIPADKISNLKEAKKMVEIQFYPNPASQDVFLTFANPTLKEGRLQLYAASGALVYESVVPENQQNYKLPVSDLKPGLFMVKYSDAKQSYSGKLQIR